jgi:hypothetical protein
MGDLSPQRGGFLKPFANVLIGDWTSQTMSDEIEMHSIQRPEFGPFVACGALEKRTFADFSVPAETDIQ